MLTASGSAGSTTIGYNGDGQAASVNDAAGTTGYTYDSAGRLATLANPVTGTTATYSYNSDSLESGISYGSGNDTRSFGYDADGRQVSQTLPAYTPPGGSQVTPVDTTAYDGDGLTTATTDGLNYTTHYTYDQLGDQVTETDPDNSVTTTAYDNDGEPLSVTSPTGAVTQTTYDYLGRRQTSTQVDRYTTSGTSAYTARYSYGDTPGAGGGGGAGDATSYAYDALGSDSATAKDLMGARWYDPSAGDFTSADSVQVDPVLDSAAANPFAYAADNPLEGMDPSGHRVVNLPGDYGNTPEQSAHIISTSQQAAAKTGADQQATAQAKALTAAAAKSHSPAAIKAAKAAQARAAAAAASLKQANAAKAAAVKALAVGQKVAAAREAKAAQRKKTTPLKPKDTSTTSVGPGLIVASNNPRLSQYEKAWASYVQSQRGSPLPETSAGYATTWLEICNLHPGLCGDALKLDEVQNQMRQGPDIHVPVVGTNQSNVVDIAATFLIGGKLVSGLKASKARWERMRAKRFYRNKGMPIRRR